MANIGSGEIRGDVFARDKSRGAKISTCFNPPLRVAHLDHLGQDEGILNRDGQKRGKFGVIRFSSPVCLSAPAAFEDCQCTCY